MTLRDSDCRPLFIQYNS